MQLTYDPETNVAYIRLARKQGQVCTVQVSEDLNVDVAPDGTIYGIELLDAKSQLGSKRKITLTDKATGRHAELAIT